MKGTIKYRYFNNEKDTFFYDEIDYGKDGTIYINRSKKEALKVFNNININKGKIRGEMLKNVLNNTLSVKGIMGLAGNQIKKVFNLLKIKFLISVNQNRTNYLGIIRGYIDKKYEFDMDPSMELSRKIRDLNFNSRLKSIIYWYMLMISLYKNGILITDFHPENIIFTIVNMNGKDILIYIPIDLESGCLIENDQITLIPLSKGDLGHSGCLCKNLKLKSFYNPETIKKWFLFNCHIIAVFMLLGINPFYFVIDIEEERFWQNFIRKNLEIHHYPDDIFCIDTINNCIDPKKRECFEDFLDLIPIDVKNSIKEIFTLLLLGDVEDENINPIRIEAAIRNICSKLIDKENELSGLCSTLCKL